MGFSLQVTSVPVQGAAILVKINRACAALDNAKAVAGRFLGVRILALLARGILYQANLAIFNGS